ncbi:molybdenum cofactor biosynthesis protein [candidate division KSB3 bacterium]|uniref:Molybdenum cofactor biosynthesis protein B n=1 Tax=candidate division KSB3 bacterium TaxID=2044937 RepID=A0A9D5JTJ6_9BACT|nr:molybdenum cofactor biosynthesis protein [candidate division KSB3 bacterium]
MGHQDHKHHAVRQVACMVITISDTRTEETDTSGQFIVELLQNTGHTVERKTIVKDDPAAIHQLLREGIAAQEVQAIICNGGTGISTRDRSYEAVEQLLDKRLEGFGELFRFLSYQEIGSAAMMSRAVAGIAQGTVIFSMPGSKHAVRLAMEQLILPEIGHIIWELTKHLDE